MKRPGDPERGLPPGDLDLILSLDLLLEDLGDLGDLLGDLDLLLDHDLSRPLPLGGGVLDRRAGLYGDLLLYGDLDLWPDL